MNDADLLFLSLAPLLLLLPLLLLSNLKTTAKAKIGPDHYVASTDCFGCCCGLQAMVRSAHCRTQCCSNVPQFVAMGRRSRQPLQRRIAGPSAQGSQISHSTPYHQPGVPSILSLYYLTTKSNKTLPHTKENVIITRKKESHVRKHQILCSLYCIIN